MPKKDQTPNAKVFNIVLPNDLVEKVDKISKDEYRNRSETIREALRNYVDQNSAGRKVHGLAAQARERGELPEALGLVFKAFEAYQQDGDHSGAAEVLVDGSIALRNRGELNDNADYLLISQGFIESAIKIAEICGDESAVVVPYFNQGKILEDLGRQEEAVQAYQKAFDGISSNPPASHANRPAIVANYKIALLIAKLRAGDMSVLDQAIKAIEELKKADEISDYNKHVWVSGAYMDLANALKDHDLKKANEFLTAAKKVIDSDPELIIRKQQWEKLAKSLQD